MEPLSALGLAANVAQFVELAFKAVHAAYEIAGSSTGLLAKHSETELIAQSTTRLQENIVLLSDASLDNDKLSRLDESLLPLRKACLEVGNELLGLLNRVKASEPRRKRKSMRVALLALVKEGKVKELEGRLINLQQQINSVVIFDIQKQQTSILALLQGGSQNAYRNMQVSKDLESVTNSVDKQLASLRSRMESLHLDQHDKEYSQDQSKDLSKVISLAEKARILSLQQKFLATLDYEMRLSRDHSIKDAHTETFQWIYREQSSVEIGAKRRKISTHAGQEPTPFLSWLEEGDGVFWITGKPGSGKSTLMRYVGDEERTHTALNKWAQGGRIATACFYFWNSGTPMQRSLEGLLRSLLLQVLGQCPELAPKIFSRRWEHFVSTPSPLMAPWYTKELLEGVKAVVAEASVNSRFCFFIDGLDEYEGTDREVVQAIASFGASKFFKFCLSSRPHAHFENAFGRNPARSLSVPSLTGGDIKRYVDDKLNKNDTFQVLRTQHSARCEKLVYDIVEYANGVFLWVHLVVDLLIEGIEINEDRISDLEKKLQRVPRELNELFRTILDSVEHDYHESQAHMLRTACTARYPLNLMAYYFMDVENEDDILRMPVEAMASQEIEKNQNIMATRINVRCKGLLEVVHYGAMPSFKTHKVEFIHRTFRDYLAEKEIENLMASRSAPGFDVYRVMCLAAFAELKASSFDMKEGCNQFDCFLEILDNASESEKTQGSKAGDILDAVFDELVGQQASITDLIERHDRSRRLGLYWEVYHFLCSVEDVIFTSAQIAASRDLAEYSKQRVAKLQSLGNSLDDLLVQTISGAHRLVVQDNYEEYMLDFHPRHLMKLLLDMGANVGTFWQQFIIEWNSAENSDLKNKLIGRYFEIEEPRGSPMMEVLLSYSDGIPEEAAAIFDTYEFSFSDSDDSQDDYEIRDSGESQSNTL